jgi:hypothetical protein
LKRFIAVFAVACVALSLMGTSASAHTGRQYRLRFFYGDAGTIRWQGGRDDTGAFFDDSPLDSNHSRLNIHVVNDGDTSPTCDPNDPVTTNCNYDYAGAYANGTGLPGQLLGNVRNLSFDYLLVNGTGSGVGIRVPIDENGDGAWDSFAFVDTRGCSEAIPGSDWRRLDVTGITTAGACTLYADVAYTSDGVNSAWDLFAAAHPTWKVATDTPAFLILDEEGTVLVDRVAFQNHMFVKYGSGPGAIKHCPMESSC